MSKAKPSGYICFDKENMTEEDRELAELYWQVHEEEPRIFVYRIDEFNKKFGLGLKKVIHMIQRHYGISFTSSRHCCDLCNCKELVFTRDSYKSLFSIKKFRCSKCVEEIAEEEELFRREQLRKFNNECLSSNYNINDFSFIEKIFMLTFLSNNDHLSFGDKFSFDKMNFVTGDQALDMQILAGLAGKNIIFDSSEYCGDLNLSSILELDPHEDILLIKQSNNYEEKNTFITDLYSNIINPAIDNNDLDDIQRIIEAIRLNNIYKALTYASEKHCIRVRKGVKIDNLFKHMARNYTLMQCARIVYFRAEKTLVKIKIDKIDCFAEPDVYGRILEGFLGKAAVEDWTIHPSTDLPHSITSSIFESMINVLFIDELNWFNMSTVEISEKWISKLNINDVE